MSEGLNIISKELVGHRAKVERDRQQAAEVDRSRIEKEVLLLKPVEEIFQEIIDSGLLKWSYEPMKQRVETPKLFGGHNVKEHVVSDYTPAKIVLDTPSHIPDHDGSRTNADPVSISLHFNGLLISLCDTMCSVVKIAVVDDKLNLVSECSHIEHYVLNNSYGNGDYEFDTVAHHYGDLTPIEPDKLAEYIAKGINNPLTVTTH